MSRPTRPPTSHQETTTMTTATVTTTILDIARSSHPKAGYITAALREYASDRTSPARRVQIKDDIDTSGRALHAAGRALAESWVAS